MVRFFQRAGEIVRGESKEEGDQRRAAEKDIKQKVRAAELVARRDEQIKLAQQRQKIIAEAQQKRLRQKFAPRKPAFGSPISGSPFGSPISAISLPRKRMKRGRNKRRSKPISQKPRQNFTGLIGGSQNVGRSKGSFDILGF